MLRDKDNYESRIKNHELISWYIWLTDYLIVY